MYKRKVPAAKSELRNQSARQLKQELRCGKIKKRKENPKIKNKIKKSLYNWIMNHPQVLQSPIYNDSIKVNISSHTRPQIVPKWLLHVSVRELHNSLVIDPYDGGIK